MTYRKAQSFDHALIKDENPTCTEQAKASVHNCVYKTPHSQGFKI